MSESVKVVYDDEDARVLVLEAKFRKGLHPIFVLFQYDIYQNKWDRKDMSEDLQPMITQAGKLSREYENFWALQAAWDWIKRNKKK